jgi:hypothetical protein
VPCKEIRKGDTCDCWADCHINVKSKLYASLCIQISFWTIAGVLAVIISNFCAVVATSDTDLYKWYENVCKNDGGQNQWSSNRKLASISAYDQGGSMRARWEITNAIITKYEGPSFKASDTAMATETMTLAHEGVKRTQ